jgi:hypothetical protein
MKDTKFLELISAQLDKLEKKLNNNFYQQGIVLAIGISLVANQESFITGLIGRLGLPSDGHYLKIVVTIMLLILFLRFGYLLSNFIAIRHTLGKLIEPFIDEYSKLDYIKEEDRRMVSYAVRPLSFFEVFTERDYLKNFKFSVFVFYLIIFCVLLANHFVFVILIQDVCKNDLLRYAILVVYLTLNVYLYLEFIKSNVSERLTKSFSAFGIIMIISMFTYLLITEVIVNI